MNTSALLQRAENWDELADEIEEWLGETPAHAIRTAVKKFEEAVEAWEEEPLPIDRAAEESGYSKERLRALIREGTIPDAGPDGARRIRRKHLPRKPGHGIQYSSPSADADDWVGSAEQEARAVVNSN